jgi:Uma2 family endonuclease
MIGRKQSGPQLCATVVRARHAADHHRLLIAVADRFYFGHISLMALAHTSLLEQPVVVHTRPAIDLDDEQLYQLCLANRDLQIERSADGGLIIMTPEGGSSGSGGTKLIILFGHWAERDGRGRVFGPSTGFILPNGAMRAPDVAWVRHERLASLTNRQWQRFLPLCPEFVLELRSPSDSLRRLQQKMEEYRDNGAQPDWLLDPVSKQVHVYRPGAIMQIMDDPSRLSGEPLLRGFTLEVPSIWAAMERESL